MQSPEGFRAAQGPMLESSPGPACLPTIPPIDPVLHSSKYVAFNEIMIRGSLCPPAGTLLANLFVQPQASRVR